jgi:hypothetical protein
MGFGRVGLDDHLVANFYRGVSQNHYVLNVGLAHSLSALRITAAKQPKHSGRGAGRWFDQRARTKTARIYGRSSPIAGVCRWLGPFCGLARFG